MTNSRTVIVQSAVALVLVLSVVACIAGPPQVAADLARILMAIAQIIRAIGRNHSAGRTGSRCCP